MTNLLSQLSDAINGALDAARASILRIDGARHGSSTGIAWSDDLVIASAHTIRRREGITVTRDDGQSFPASVVGGDGGTDIALLRVEGAALRPMQWSSRAPRAGDLVIVAGRPGRSVRATIGVASAVGGEWQTHDGSRIDRFIDVDASLPRGFSGGPLLDGEGAAVGLNTSRVAPGGTTIPRATVERVVHELQQHGRVAKPLLGVGVYPVEQGLLVMSVKEGSSAANAGILVGDIIEKVDGTEVTSPRELHAAISRKAVGDKIDLTCKRAGESRTIKLDLGSTEDRGPRTEDRR